MGDRESGYDNCECEENVAGLFRSILQRAASGKRGKKLLEDIVQAMMALSEPRLLSDNLEVDGEVCALGAVLRARNIVLNHIDCNAPGIARALDAPETLVREIISVNDDEFGLTVETPEERFKRFGSWAWKVSQGAPVG